MQSIKSLLQKKKVTAKTQNDTSEKQNNLKITAQGRQPWYRTHHYEVV